MASTPDLASCISSNGHIAGGLSPVNPFYALRYQFGMLLGVDDFETEQAYHRGKTRLHNAWLHREGVVWGLDVQIDTARNEIKVTPGLALDAAGRELHLDVTACVDVTKWYDVHKNDPGFTSAPTATGGVKFDAHVVIGYQACLTRQVPAILEPCQDQNVAGTAYSRVSETVALSLLPGIPAPPVRPYWRLRLLFWLDPPAPGVTLSKDAQEVVDARNAILSLPLGKQPHAYVDAFRRFAALDEIDLRPAKAADGSLLLFPAADDTTVLLADITGITLEKNSSGALVLTAGTVDTTVRPSHVATAAIEELLCGPTFLATPLPAAVGPRVTAGSVTLVSKTITFTTDSALAPGTVQPPAFSATFLDSGGASAWQDLVVGAAAWNGPGKTVTLTLNNAPGTGTIRLIARGTGPAPLTGPGPGWIPLGGSSSSANGEDFVWMKEVS
jgi:hypothetical protein